MTTQHSAAKTFRTELENIVQEDMEKRGISPDAMEDVISFKEGQFSDWNPSEIDVALDYLASLQ